MKLSLPSFLILLFWSGGLAFVACVPGKNVWASDYACTEVGSMYGYRVMECPHPFAVAHYSRHPEDCSWEVYRRPHGPDRPCGWVNAYTDRSTKTVWYWEQSPESLEHEKLHVLRLIGDDQ